jgi:arylsulfatase A-like enzyme
VQSSAQTSPDRSPATAGLVFACVLAVALLLASYARIVGDVGSAAFNIQIVRSALDVPLWHTRLGLNIALFALALLALHLAFGLSCWLLAALSGKAFPDVRCSRRQWVLGWFLLGAAWLLIANATRFPHSSLGEPYRQIADSSVFGAQPLAIATCGLLAAMILTALLAMRRMGSRRTVWLVLGTAVVATASGFTWKHAAHAAPRSDAPNVIFLGIDSLRPDAVDAQTAPHVSAFLDGAVQFPDAITPLARTFPSWMSVLTGRHPHTTGAYMNLLPASRIHSGTTLPELLREHGYRTYYAIDETRFSNIDASYGFDHTATPTIGGTDFVLTWFGDTPLSNLVTNTWLGAWLFPHLHANRAAHVVYDPDSFVHRVDREFDFDQPVFLATHLTLPHWPFTWATSDADEPDSDHIDGTYRQVVRRADQQFGDLLAMLKGRGVLDNALVIVLSDHGEALGRADDFTPEAFPGEDDASTRAQRWGHGTSVFSPHQYRVVLGIRAYGRAQSLISQAGMLKEPVSLLDLTPTVLDLLHMQPQESFDGQSLAGLLQSTPGAADQFDGRIRFTESEYNPQGFSLESFTPSALATAARVYRLDPATDRIAVRPDLIDWIMSTRQYAALLDDSFAAAVPGEAGGEPYRFVFEPGHGPDTPLKRARLRQALEDRFGIRFGSETTSIKPTS